MVRHRAAVAAPLCCLLVLVGLAAPAAADLTIDVQQAQGALDIYADGASTLSAPQNTTIREVRTNGYLIDWSPPSLADGQQLAGYTLYRVPGPGATGALQVTHLGSRQSTAYSAPGAGNYVYFVTAVLKGTGAPESVPGSPVSSADAKTNYPHCNVVGIYTAPPYYDSHLGCLFPIA
jgi:hypothetical protein